MLVMLKFTEQDAFEVVALVARFLRDNPEEIRIKKVRKGLYEVEVKLSYAEL